MLRDTFSPLQELLALNELLAQRRGRGEGGKGEGFGCERRRRVWRVRPEGGPSPHGREPVLETKHVAQSISAICASVEQDAQLETFSVVRRITVEVVTAFIIVVPCFQCCCE